jgi:hypothetical protein
MFLLLGPAPETFGMGKHSSSRIWARADSSDGCDSLLSAIEWCYLTSMVVTLSAGSVKVNEEPLAGIVPMETGCTGVCPWAEAAVI